MEHYAGIDVLELSSVCVVDAKGKIVKEAKVASEPDALLAVLKNGTSGRVCYTFRSYLLEMSSHLAQFAPMAARN